MRKLPLLQRNAPPRTHNTTNTKPTPSQFGRLVVDFGSETVHQLPPDKIKDKLNGLFDSYGVKGSAARIAGAWFSRRGNLVLTVTPAVATKDILASDCTSATIGCLRDCLDFSETAAQHTRIYSADPWHRVVIQNITLRDIQPGLEEDIDSWYSQKSDGIISDWEELNPLARSVAVHCKITARFLTRRGDIKAKGSTSLCIAFDNVKYARSLCQEGAFIHDTHCRVSPYTPSGLETK